MGYPKYMDVPENRGQGVSFENKLNQIHYLFPSLPDMYYQFIDLVVEFYYKEMARLSAQDLDYDYFIRHIDYFIENTQYKKDNDPDTFDELKELYSQVIADLFELEGKTLVEYMEELPELIDDQGENYDNELYHSEIELIKQSMILEIFRSSLNDTIKTNYSDLISSFTGVIKQQLESGKKKEITMSMGGQTVTYEDYAYKEYLQALLYAMVFSFAEENGSPLTDERTLYELGLADIYNNLLSMGIALGMILKQTNPTFISNKPDYQFMREGARFIFDLYCESETPTDPPPPTTEN